MNRWSKCVCTLILSSGILAIPARAGSGAEAFEKLKTLVGHWETVGAAEKSTLDVQLTAGGTVILERSHESIDGKPVEMTTTYFLDGDQLRMTHYCMAGNQPTMQGTYSPNSKTITFDFVSATNMKSSDDGHMHHAVYTLVDNDHLKMLWTFRKNQKDAFSEDISYVRTK
jgi:hypothetical protein